MRLPVVFFAAGEVAPPAARSILVDFLLLRTRTHTPVAGAAVVLERARQDAVWFLLREAATGAGI